MRPLKILPYKTGSTSDYKRIEGDITERLAAVANQDAALQKLASSPATLPALDGLADFERVALALVVEEHLTGGISAWELHTKMEKIRYTKAASTFAVLNLQQKQLIEIRPSENYNGDTYPAIFLTNSGVAWMRDHLDALVIRIPPPPSKLVDYPEQGITDDDIPF